jgi:hypothetical protein
MPDNPENPRGNNPETSLHWPDGFNENYYERFEPKRPEPEWPDEIYEIYPKSFDPERFKPERPEPTEPARPDRFNKIYSHPQKSGEADKAAQQPPESNPNSRYQRVTAYLGSLMERVGLRGDSEERGQDQPGGEEYDQVEDDMNRITDIETRVHQGEELTAQDIYFLRKYDSETQNSGYEEEIDRRFKYREPEPDIDKMLENFEPTEVVRRLMSRGLEGERILAESLDKFPDGAVDHFQLARKLMGMDSILAENLDKFQYGAVDHTKFARRLMDSGEHGMTILARNLEKFHYGAVDHAELAQDMMDGDLLSKMILTDNLDKFQPGALDHSEFARDLMNNDLEPLLAQNLDKFRDVPADILDELPLPDRCRRLLRISSGYDAQGME